jgi:hypothetical protein
MFSLFSPRVLVAGTFVMQGAPTPTANPASRFSIVDRVARARDGGAIVNKLSQAGRLYRIDASPACSGRCPQDPAMDAGEEAMRRPRGGPLSAIKPRTAAVSTRQDGRPLACGPKLASDRHRVWVLCERLERGRLTDPARPAGASIAMSELVAWLEDIDLSRTRRLKAFVGN